MLVFSQCVVDISWHADVSRAVVVVLFDGHATEKRARPVNEDFKPLLQCVDEVMGMVTTNNLMPNHHPLKRMLLVSNFFTRGQE